MKTVSMRNYYFYREYKRYFSSVTVISTSNQQLLLQEPLPLDEADLHFAKTLDYRTLINFRKRTNINQPESGKGKITRNFIRLLDSFPFNCLFGEGGLLYILHGYFLGKKMVRQQGVTHVHSSFRPYSDHLIAFLLKKTFSRLFWIADMRDLHVDDSVDNVIFPRFQHRCNRLILSKADAATTVSEGLAGQLKKYRKDVRVLLYGVGQIPAPLPSVQAMKKFTITYTGSLFYDKRDPSPLLLALSELIKDNLFSAHHLNLVYAGKDGTSWKHYLEKYRLTDFFTDLGMVPFAASRQLQSDSHLNLLLIHADTGVTGNLSSKFFEYLAARKPLVVLVKGGRDEEMERIVRKTGAGLVAGHSPEDIGRIKGFILEKYDEWAATGAVAQVIAPETLNEYRWDHIVGKWLEETIFDKKEVVAA